ncbi:MAG: ATP-binding protein [Coriobacteriales bacterium]|jgi:hypothetical protein
MNELQKRDTAEMAVQDMTMENRLAVIEDGIRKKYLARLTEMQIVPVGEMLPLEEDLIQNVRLYHVAEMVYEKGERVTDKFTTVFNTLSTYNATAFIIMDSDGKRTDFYVGVRNTEEDESQKRSTVTLGDTLKNTLIGHFPGMKIEGRDRASIARLSGKILNQQNVASVSVVGNSKSTDSESNEQFVQGLEKLAFAMQGRQYIGIIIAESQSPQMVQLLRKEHQDLYTKLSPLQKVQLSESTSKTTSRSKSFAEMDGKQRAALLGGALTSLGGVIGGAVIGASVSEPAVGSMIGGQIAGQLSGFINTLAPSEQISDAHSYSTSTSTENKTVTDMLQMLDDSLKRTREFDSYGMWNVAAYFLSDEMSAAEIAASNYRSLMNGENSGREVSAINSWRGNNPQIVGDYRDLTTYLSRFVHPLFYYGSNGEYSVVTNASTTITGKELGIHMELPRATVSGLPVIEHAEFGKEVTTYKLFSRDEALRPEDRITLGKIFDLGQITGKVVELENKSLNMHTFITGSTGSGKSNTVYQMLSELHQDKIPFLVVEPAKGEYKDVFGNWPDVNVYSTNPNMSELVNINPFKFPDSIHVLEHVDGLVEIFSVCWPMYDAMPAFFKDAILRSYEEVGWDLGSSTFDGDEVEYPDFDVLVEQLNALIEESDYASDIKSNYRGALITRVKSLTVGLNNFIFTTEQTPYEKLFDENCILDISRVKSTETKALIMGLIVYILNEYRVDRKTESNNGLKHVTVLEEAHNLLKNTSGGGESALIGKSVEMLTQTIAEIRTYGEGFIIVDQSPSSVDIAAIKNTNTKIVLRTPEANDREAVGRSIGLSPDQVNEIAKLPSGVAVVYQNDWVAPVLTMIDKASVSESPYVPVRKTTIRTLRSARLQILRMLMQPWIGKSRIDERELRDSLKVLSMPREQKKAISALIDDYTLCNGLLKWSSADIPELQKLVQAVLGFDSRSFEDLETPDELRREVEKRLKKCSQEDIDDICFVLTSVEVAQ